MSLIRVPLGLLDGLPVEDQQAIVEAVGTFVLLTDLTEDGAAELQFTDSSGVIHYIYVPTDCIQEGGEA